MERQELLGFKDFLKLLAENIEKNAGKIKVIATIMYDITNEKEYKEIAELAEKIFEEKYSNNNEKIRILEELKVLLNKIK
jgi:N-acetylglucosamine kinase-like BadF-type ATPase